MSPKQEVLDELDNLINSGKRLYALRGSSPSGDEVAQCEIDLQSFVTSSFAAIVRVDGRDNDYYRAIPRDGLGQPLFKTRHGMEFVPVVIGALQAFRDAIERGYLVSIESRLVANVHDDFLGQARELLSKGFYVAAMVIAGGVLENHLRKMVANRGIVIQGNGSLSKYNNALKDNAYNQAKWRMIQSFCDLRNSAAHGEYVNVDQRSVEDAITFISRFIAETVP